MRDAGKYIRRTISISPHVDEILNAGANREFGGNFSAFLAHVVLDYVKCKDCFSNSRRWNEKIEHKEQPANAAGRNKV